LDSRLSANPHCQFYFLLFKNLCQVPDRGLNTFGRVPSFLGTDLLNYTFLSGNLKNIDSSLLWVFAQLYTDVCPDVRIGFFELRGKGFF
jgi:hypothetical protein